MHSAAESWSERESAHTRRIVDSVNFIRERRGLTIAGLAELLRESGWTISAATLNGILGSHKRTSIGTAELLVFADALGVPATYLLLGLPDAQAPDPVSSAPRSAGGSAATAALSRLLGRNRGASDSLSMTTSQLVNALFHYSVNLDALLWLNAQLAVLNDRTDKAAIAQRQFVEGQLTEDIVPRLREDRLEFRELFADLISLPPLPESLAFLDSNESAIWPIDALVDPDLRARAQQHIGPTPRGERRA